MEDSERSGISITKCPKCKGPVDFGYGYGLGPGIGDYVFCLDMDNCKWSHKEQDMTCLLPGEKIYKCQCVWCEKNNRRR